MLQSERGIIHFSCFLLLAVLIVLVTASPAQADPVNISLTITGTSTPPVGGGGNPPNPVHAEVLISGLAYPSADLTFLRDGVVIGTGRAAGNGTFTRGFLVDPGTMTFGVWARDRYSLISPTVSISFELEPHATARIENVALPPTIAHEHIGADGSLTFYGSAFPESVVRIFNNINTFMAPFTTIADSRGVWRYTVSRGGFNPSNFSYKANYQDEDSGILSPFSSNLELRLVTCLNSDFNGDGVVNLTDLSILLFYWGRAVPKTGLTNECVDRNQDQIVDLTDFSILMYEWTVLYQQQ